MVPAMSFSGNVIPSLVNAALAMSSSGNVIPSFFNADFSVAFFWFFPKAGIL